MLFYKEYFMHIMGCILPDSQCKIGNFTGAFKHLYRIWATEWLNRYSKYTREWTYSLLALNELITPAVNGYSYTSHKEEVRSKREGKLQNTDV